MRRTKEWWNRLSKDERRHLVYLERHQGSSRSAYLPDDCSQCDACGYPVLGFGWCKDCGEYHDSLLAKANGKETL